MNYQSSVRLYYGKNKPKNQRKQKKLFTFTSNDNIRYLMISLADTASRVGNYTYILLHYGTFFHSILKWQCSARYKLAVASNELLYNYRF